MTDIHLLVRHESDQEDQVYTAGTRLAFQLDAWDAGGEGMAQFGEFGGMRHLAAALHVEGGYTLPFVTSRIGLGYSLGTGDSDPNDDKRTTFDNLYPLNHAYYGYMDFFSLQNIHNPELILCSKPLPRLVVRGAYHAFWLAQEDTDAWYNAGLGVVRQADTDVSPYVGSELDLTASMKFLDEHFTLSLGYSHYFTGLYVAQTGPSQDADFFYLKTLLKI